LRAAPPRDIAQSFRRSRPGSSTLDLRTSLRWVDRAKANTPIATTPTSDTTRIRTDIELTLDLRFRADIVAATPQPPGTLRRSGR